MIELKIDEFKSILPHLTKLVKYNYILYSVIDGSVKARVFVNNKTKIETILLWDQTDCAGIYIEGKYSPVLAKEMNEIVHDIIIPEGKLIEDTKDIACCYHPIEIWEDKLASEVFKGIDIRKDTRKFFTFDKGINEIFTWRDNFPSEFQMYQFDEKSPIISRRDLKNYESMIDMLKYSNDKFGCCIVDEKENTIVSWCTSDWRGGKNVEFGVRTDENYRKRGFGSMCAAAAVEFALKRGYEHIGWHCWGDNTASAKTALRAGYVHERTHPVMHFWYNAFDNMVVAAYTYYNRQEYEKALENFYCAEKMRDDQTSDFQAATFNSDEYHQWHRLGTAACY